MNKLILILISLFVWGFSYSQESYYAHVENYEVVSVEVVTDSFVQANPERYTGKWIKVGYSKMPFCGKGFVYITERDTIIIPRPFEDWILSKDYTWIEPTLINKIFNSQ